MIERVKDRFDLQPLRLAGDTVYGAVRLLKWLVDRQITPHIPVWDKSARSDGTFSRADFVFDRSHNIYICPNGKLLHTTGTVIDGSTLRYRASKLDCDDRETGTAEPAATLRALANWPTGSRSPSSLGSFCQKSRPRLCLIETTAADLHSPQHF
jgi:hypothetical protein